MITRHPHPDPPFPYGGRRHHPPDLFAPAVVADAVTAGYPGAAGPAVAGLSFTLAGGRLAAVVGPNGAGKSTVLKAVAGLVRPTGGAVRVFGLPPGGCHHRTAYLPQRGDIDWGFPVTVERLVLTGRYVHLGWLRWPGRADRLAARRALDRVGMRALAGRPVGDLSGGQQQRALVARALAQGADLLLLDEPFNHLDAAARADLLGLLGELRDAGKTLLVATHDFPDPDGVFDDVLRLRAGRLEPDAVPA